MSINAKKLTIKETVNGSLQDTSILVDYAEKDGAGNNIETTYASKDYVADAIELVEEEFADLSIQTLSVNISPNVSLLQGALTNGGSCHFIKDYAEIYKDVTHIKKKDESLPIESIDEIAQTITEINLWAGTDEREDVNLMLLPSFTEDNSRYFIAYTAKCIVDVVITYANSRFAVEVTCMPRTVVAASALN